MLFSLRRHAQESITPLDAGALLAQARALKLAAQSGAIQPLLKGKNLGLLCESLDDADAALFRRAASDLGARVSHIRPSLTMASAPQVVAHTARMLGLLYDAVECQGVASALVHRLDDAAGVPVYDGIATPGHPTAGLAAQLNGAESAGDNRCYVVQAVLLATMG